MFWPGVRLKLSQFAAAGQAGVMARAGDQGSAPQKRGDACVSPNYFSIRNRYGVIAYFSTIIRVRISRCRAWQKWVQ